MATARSRRATPLTRAAIVAATRELLRTTDLSELSLRRLAAVLEVTAPALYAHVEDKEDLLTAVAEEGFAELVAAFDSVTATDPVGRLAAYARAYVQHAVADPEMFKMMFMFRPGAVPLSGVDNELAAASAAFDKPAEAIAAAMGSGSIHPDRDPLLTAMTLWTTTHGVASVLLLGAHGGGVVLPDNAGDLVDDVLSVTLAGLRHPPTGSSSAQADE